MTPSLDPLPLPDSPVLSAWAWALNDAGYWANVLDAEWRYVFQTDELRRTMSDMGWALAASMVGLHYFSREAGEHLAPTVGGPFAEHELYRAWFLELGPYALADLSGGRDELRGLPIPNSRSWSTSWNPETLPAVHHPDRVHNRRSRRRRIGGLIPYR